MLYAPTVLVLKNICLDAHEDYYPRGLAVKRNCHWMVKIDNGKGMRKASTELATDKFYGEGDQFFLKYPICDDVELQPPLPGGKKVQVVKQAEIHQTMSNQVNKAKVKCSKCKQSRHNVE